MFSIVSLLNIILILLFGYHPFELLSILSVISFSFFGFGYLFFQIFNGINESQGFGDPVIYSVTSIVFTTILLYISSRVTGFILLNKMNISMILSMFCVILVLFSKFSTHFLCQKSVGEVNINKLFINKMISVKKNLNNFISFLKVEKSFMTLFIVLIVVFGLIIPLSVFFRISQNGYSSLAITNNNNDLDWTSRNYSVDEDILLFFQVTNHDFNSNQYGLKILNNGSEILFYQSGVIGMGEKWEGSLNLSFSSTGSYQILISLFLNQNYDNWYSQIEGWIKIDDL